MAYDDDGWCWTILDANNAVWEQNQATIMNVLISNCDECVMPLPIRKKRRREICSNKVRNSPSEEDSDDAAVESSEPGDMLRNEFSSDAEFERAERDAIDRVQTRKEYSERCEQITDDIVAKELNNIAESILDCERYELTTTGKSSWTLKKIAHQIRELKHILFVDCHITIPTNLLHLFAERVFIGKRKHLRHSFLFQFTTS